MKVSQILALILLLVSPYATVSAADTQRALIQNRGSDGTVNLSRLIVILIKNKPETY
jgi:hypothetical protein